MDEFYQLWALEYILTRETLRCVCDKTLSCIGVYGVLYVNNLSIYIIENDRTLKSIYLFNTTTFNIKYIYLIQLHLI